MMGAIRQWAWVLLAATALAQTPSGTRPTFEVASIKPSNADSGSTSGIKTGRGQLDADNVTLKRCIMGAYGVGPHQISGGPDWLDSDRFAIAAKVDQPLNDVAVFMTMLQGLLAERFKLALHRETRTVTAFALEVAKKGPRLEKAVDGEARTNTSNSNSGTVIAANYTSMDSFAKILARQMDLPVVNRTGLEGIFNFKLEWARDTKQGPSIFTAIQEQLGLRLSSQKAPVEVLVIDHAEKPSEN